MQKARACGQLSPATVLALQFPFQLTTETPTLHLTMSVIVSGVANGNSPPPSRIRGTPPEPAALTVSLAVRSGRLQFLHYIFYSKNLTIHGNEILAGVANGN